MKDTSTKDNDLKVPIENEFCGWGGTESGSNFFPWLPVEITVKIFSQLDIQSLCRASETCWSWNITIRDNDDIWKPHCLALRAVCQREINADIKNGYTWRETFLRNYQKSRVKHEWLSGRYSNICSLESLPENSMCPMDADTWGEILEAEMNRDVERHLSRLRGFDCT